MARRAAPRHKTAASSMCQGNTVFPPAGASAGIAWAPLPAPFTRLPIKRRQEEWGGTAGEMRSASLRAGTGQTRNAALGQDSASVLTSLQRVTERHPERALLFVPARPLARHPRERSGTRALSNRVMRIGGGGSDFFFLFKKLQIVHRPLNSISPLQQTHIKIITLLGFEIPRELPELQPSTAVDNAKGMHGRLSRREDEMINHSG